MESLCKPEAALFHPSVLLFGSQAARNGPRGLPPSRCAGSFYLDVILYPAFRGYAVGYTWNPRASVLSQPQRQGADCRLGMQPVNWPLVMYGMTYSCDPTLLLSSVVRKHNCTRDYRLSPNYKKVLGCFFSLEFLDCCVNSYTAIESILNSC